MQEAILEPYITFNSHKRSLARFKFEISFWKNLCNFLFGKTLQGVKNQLDVQIVTSSEQVSKFARDPRFYEFREINEKVSLFLMKRNKVKLDKPIFIGFAILELSKQLVYMFHYIYMGNIYGKNCSLLTMDTDGLVYHIKTLDAYRDLQENIQIFDTSDFPDGHFLKSDHNKKRPGTVKDEKNGNIIKSCAKAC